MTVIVITLVILVLAINTRGSTVLPHDPELSSASSNIYQQTVLNAYIKNLERRNFRGDIDDSTKKFIAVMLTMGLNDPTSRAAFNPIAKMVKTFAETNVYVGWFNKSLKLTGWANMQQDAWFHLFFTVVPAQPEMKPSFPPTKFGWKQTEIEAEKLLNYADFGNFPAEIPVMERRVDLVDLLALGQIPTLESFPTFTNWIVQNMHSIVYTNDHARKNMLRRRAKLPELNVDDDKRPMLQITCRFAKNQAYRYAWAKIKSNPSIYFKFFRDYPYLEIIITANLTIGSNGQVILAASHIRCSKAALNIMGDDTWATTEGTLPDNLSMRCSNMGGRANRYYYNCTASVSKTWGWDKMNSAILVCDSSTPNISHTPLSQNDYDKYTNFHANGCSIVDFGGPLGSNNSRFKGRRIDEWTSLYQRSQPRFLSMDGQESQHKDFYSRLRGIITYDGYMGVHNNEHFVDLTLFTDYCVYVSGDVDDYSLHIRCPGVPNPKLKTMDEQKSNKRSGSYQLRLVKGDPNKQRSDATREDHFVVVPSSIPTTLSRIVRTVRGVPGIWASDAGADLVLKGMTCGANFVQWSTMTRPSKESWKAENHDGNWRREWIGLCSETGLGTRLAGHVGKPFDVSMTSTMAIPALLVPAAGHRIQFKGVWCGSGKHMLYYMNNPGVEHWFSAGRAAGWKKEYIGNCNSDRGLGTALVGKLS